MKSQLLVLLFCISFGASVFARYDTIPVSKENMNTNAAGRLLSGNSDNNLTIGGYAQIDYNQPISSDKRYNGTLDVHRLVMLFGYRFSDRLDFVTEIELEHVKELYVEQAFLRYKINRFLNIQGGLMLIPMGIINEYHEPPTFNGVERPNNDKYIVPTTWREIGIGINGNIPSAGIKYQLYMVNGFKSFDGSPTLSGSSGLRGGRQKGANSIISSPNFSGKLDYYGIKGLNLGIASYQGKTSTSLFKGIEKTSEPEMQQADSSVVNISMFSFDTRYSVKGIMLRGQIVLANLGNTEQYNTFSKEDLGSQLFGYYFEAGYNIFEELNIIDKPLVIFLRYEYYNTHNKVTSPISVNKKFEREEFITGLGFWLANGAAVKTDIRFYKNESESSFNKMVNAGIAVWF